MVLVLRQLGWFASRSVTIIRMGFGFSDAGESPVRDERYRSDTFGTPAFWRTFSRLALTRGEVFAPLQPELGVRNTMSLRGLLTGKDCEVGEEQW